MFPTHPDTICTLSAFDYQQLLRDAEKERIAAGAQQGQRLPLTRSQGALLSAASRLGSAVKQLLGVKGALPPASQPGAHPNPAGHGI